PGRGDDHGRPHRGDERRSGATDCRSGPAVRPSRQPVRRRFHRRTTDEFLSRRAATGRRRPLVRRRNGDARRRQPGIQTATHAGARESAGVQRRKNRDARAAGRGCRVAGRQHRCERRLHGRCHRGTGRAARFGDAFPPHNGRASVHRAAWGGGTNGARTEGLRGLQSGEVTFFRPDDRTGHRLKRARAQLAVLNDGMRATLKPGRWVWAAILLASFLLASNRLALPRPRPDRLRFSHTFTTESERAILDAAVAEFERTHPGVTIEQMVSNSEVYNTVGWRLQFQGRNQPDIYFHWQGFKVEYCIENNWAMNLTPYLAPGFLETFIPSAIRKQNGGVYFLPQSVDISNLIWYNQ